MEDQLPEYLTVDEVAKRYRTSPGNIRYWRHIGQGPKGVRVGARVLFPRAEVQRFDRELAEKAAAAVRATA